MFVMFSIMTAFGLYRREFTVGDWGYYARFMSSFLVGLMAMTQVFYVFPGLFLGRGAFGFAFLYALLLVALARYLFLKYADHDALKRRILVIGAGSRASEIDGIAHEGLTRGNFQVVGYMPLRSERPAVKQSRILPDNCSLMSLVEKYSIDEIVVGARDRRGGHLSMPELLECKLDGISVVDLPTFFERETGYVRLDSLNPSWMVYSDGFRRGAMRNLVKRVFDICASSILLIIMFPVMFLTALLVWLETGNPVLYRQQRVGECGRPFEILKFRSMRVNAGEESSPRWAEEDDARITRVGRVIRKLRIDELPQIINVLRGEMSFVGPRPEQPYFVNQLSKEISYYSCRHSVKPGITGWAQIRYPYGASVDDAERKLQYDLYYAKNHGLFLDLIILFQTTQVVLFGRGAR